MAMVGVSHSGFHYLPLVGRVAARVEVLLALTALRMMLEVGELRLRVIRTVPWTLWPSLRVKLSGVTVMVLGVWVTLLGEGRA
jgi:hypothetical protein